MPSRLEITIDGDDWSDRVRDESVALVSAAIGGEIGQGGFDLTDAALAHVPALKDVTVEDPRATVPRLLTGVVGQRTIARGQEKRATNRDWDVALWDVNALWDGIILTGSDANRPAETDYARMAWLATKLAAHGIAVGVMPNTNTVNMDAVDYREDPLPRRVASDCGEAAQKNYFLYDYGAGPLIYYDKHTGTSLSSSLKLSSVLADVDHSTVFELQLGAQLELDPTDIYSAGRFKYQGGHVDLEDTDIGLTTAADFRDRVAFIQDSTVKSSTKATNKLTKYLTAASTERRRFTGSVELPAEFAGDIQAGQRIQIKVPHLSSDALDTTAYVWFRITRCTTTEAPTKEGTSRERYLLKLEFADDVKLTSFHDARPGDTSDTSEVATSSAVSLTRYQLFEEIGGGPFGPAAGLWYSVDPDFSFGSISSAITSEVLKRPEHNVPFSYTDCGVGTGAVAGLAIKEAWYRCQVDLDTASVVGIRVTVDDLSGTADGFAIGDGTLIVAIHTGASSTGAEVTAAGQWVECGRVGSGGGVVWIPASLLIDNGSGYCWIVVAPAWEISSGLLICNSAGAKPEGYVELGAASGGDAPVLVSAELIEVSGHGLSPWLPATGDVDGTNATFGLPLWNGSGVPEIRVGSAILMAGEFDYDAGALEVTLSQAPGAELDGQVFYRAPMG